MKRTFLTALLVLACIGVRGQDIQEMYDVNRGHLTTTLEYFDIDPWGYTFLFTDIYHAGLFGPAPSHPTEFYTEIGHTFCPKFSGAWGGLGLHGEWNGGNYAANCWLIGPEYQIASGEGSSTFTFQAMYKHICNGERNRPVQFTFVWDLPCLFGVKGLHFCGFLDVWGEHLCRSVRPAPRRTLRQRSPNGYG